MGYYTNYTLTWKPTEKSTIEFPRCNHNIPDGSKFCPECGAQNLPVSLDDKIAEYIKQHSDTIYGVNESGEGTGATKWYDHETDLRSMSKVFRNIVFTLYGEGEESGDIWSKYFMNGKMQEAKARIVIDDFDASKLD